MKEFGIGKKTLIGGILLVGIPILLIGLFSTTTIMNSLEEISGQRVFVVAEKLAEMCNLVLEEEMKITKEMAEDKSISELAVEVIESSKTGSADASRELNAILAGKKKTLGDDYESICIADGSGKVIADNVNGGFSKISIADRPYFKKSLKGETIIGDAVKSKATGLPVITASAPVRDGSGKIRGVLVLILHIEFLTEKITGTRLGATGYAALVNNDAITIAHPNREFILKFDLKGGLSGHGDALIKHITDNSPGIDTYVFNGVTKLAGIAPVPITKWSLMVVQNQGDLLAPAYRIRNAIIWVGIIFLVITIGFIIVYTRNLSRPMILMAESARRLSVGDLKLTEADARLMAKAKERRDEIGRIGRAFGELTEYIHEKATASAQIADGDLTCKVRMASKQDVLGQSFQKMIDHLNDIMARVGKAASQVAAGTTQVSDSSQSLSQGATEQASSMEEITSSVTQLASQTKINADNASQANRLSVLAREKAERGNDQIREMTEAMSGISDSSKEIAKIIKTIDDIAFQTNLLALNAAVEAARAGKHGKGFAVVAQEVRNLAGRSAKAAQETAVMIDGALKTIDNGSGIADRTADALVEIVDGAARVADLVGDIAAASNEQAQGIAQINQGLTQVEQVTQQNTANAEETASASEELSGQADSLRQLVSFFKLDGNNHRNVTPPKETPVVEEWRIGHDADEDVAWGGHASPETREVKPEQVISLDDEE